jgi:hypothetical protein
MKNETYSPNRTILEDPYDEAEDFSGPGLSEPKRSPMRRKEKFRTKGFQAHKKHKSRKRNNPDKMNYDLLF